MKAQGGSSLSGKMSVVPTVVSVVSRGKAECEEGLWWLWGPVKRMQEFRWCLERGQRYVVASGKESYG